MNVTHVSIAPYLAQTIRNRKGYVNFLSKKPPCPKNGQMRPQNSFLQFLRKILLFPKKLFNMKIFSS